MKIIKPEKLEMAADLYRTGLSITSVSKQLGITHQVISRYLEDMGIRKMQRKTILLKKSEIKIPETFGRYIDCIRDDDFGLKVGDKVKIHVTCSGTDEKEKNSKGTIEGIYDYFFLIKTDKGYRTTVLKTAIGNEVGAHAIRRI